MPDTGKRFGFIRWLATIIAALVFLAIGGVVFGYQTFYLGEGDRQKLYSGSVPGVGVVPPQLIEFYVCPILGTIQIERSKEGSQVNDYCAWISGSTSEDFTIIAVDGQSFGFLYRSK